MSDRFKEIVDKNLDLTNTQRGETIRQDRQGKPQDPGTRERIQKKGNR
jgi:hypothetical protein